MAGWWTLSACVTAQADTGPPEIRLRDLDTMYCLTPSPEELRKVEYPAEVLERKQGGTVTVEFVFRSATEAPAVRVIEPQPHNPALPGSTRLENAVRDHLSQFRMPCMKPGDDPIALRQEFVFTPNDGRKVMYTRPIQGPGQPTYDCILHLDGGRRERYPKRAMHEGQEGRIVAQLTFVNRDEAPQVELFDSTFSLDLRRYVLRDAKKLRMPCMGQTPLRLFLAYEFAIEDGRRTLLRDLSLVQLLRGAAKYPEPAYFDFNSMGCPFDVILTYRQPLARSWAYEVESSVPARLPFLNWLEQVQLKLTQHESIAIFGDTVTISVPCGSLDL